MKNRKLTKLQKEWYSVLKKDGFQDIEYFDGNMEAKDMMYKEATKFAITSVASFTSTEQYYIEARQFLFDYEFLEDFDKSIWSLHSDGVSYRKIAEQLGTYYPRVFKTVNKYKSILLNNRKEDNKQV